MTTPPVRAVTTRSAENVPSTTASEWYRVAVNGEGSPASTEAPSCSTGAVLPCSELGRVRHGAPVRLAERLVTEAHPEHGVAVRAHSAITSSERPASAGTPEPGETRTPS